ncbi:MAG: hypothetical protein SPL67_03665 [Prevotella sp.]|jgi:hypothetical protein|nr:hypothetical protein [Prevotella sp.]
MEGSRRVNELFGAFLQLVNEHYQESRDVAYYAGQLNISTKYLAQIVNKISTTTASSAATSSSTPASPHNNTARR